MSIDLKPRAAGTRRGKPSTPAEEMGLAAPPRTPEPPRLPGRRNPRWIALSVVALCLGGLLSYVIYTRVATETAVVAVTRTVYRGEAIGEADLTTFTLHGAGLPNAVPARELKTLVAQHAVFDLPAGSIVTRPAIADTAVPAPGRAAVGLKIATGRAPEALLLPSAPVRLVALPQGTSGAAASDNLAGETYVARVIDHAPGPDGTSLVVDVDVSADQAPTVARLGAAERIAIVRDAGR